MDSSQIFPETVPTPARRLFQDSMNTSSFEIHRASKRRPFSFSISDIMKSDDVQTSESNTSQTSMRIPLTRPETAYEAVKATKTTEGLGCLQLEHLLRYPKPESPQTSYSGGKLSHPYVDRFYLQNKFERCEIPALRLSLHHLQSHPELPFPRLKSCQETSNTITHPVSPLPKLDTGILKKSSLPPSSDPYDFADEDIDVEGTSPNGSTASSGFYSNPSPTPSSDSSSISGRTSPNAQEEVCVSERTSTSIQEEDRVSERISPSTQEEDRVSANPRKNYSEKQVRRLKQVFLENKYPDVELYEDLSQKLDIPVQRLKVWFQNRRARNKRASDTNTMNYPLLQQNMAAMLSPAPGYGYMSPMMHQSMYQYPVPHVSMMYPPSLYPGYPYPFHSQQ